MSAVRKPSAYKHGRAQRTFGHRCNTGQRQAYSLLCLCGTSLPQMSATVALLPQGDKIASGLASLRLQARQFR